MQSSRAGEICMDEPLAIASRASLDATAPVPVKPTGAPRANATVRRTREGPTLVRTDQPFMPVQFVSRRS